MIASVTVLLSVVSSLLPLVKQASQTYAELKSVYDSVRAAHAENRDLTDEEFTTLMARLRAAGDELDALATQAQES